MSPANQWSRFFDAHAARYDENAFTQHTQAEVDFLLNLYPLRPGAAILDVGCGTGRHSIELARRGYRVTGLDLSPAMLEVAREKARLQRVEVEWVHADATDFDLGREFDAAICLCEGGVGLIETASQAETHDLSIFRQIARHLKSSAPFVMTTLNGYSIIRQMQDEHIADGRFDSATMVANYQDEWDLPEGLTLVTIVERLFIAPEIVKMLREAGFVVDAVYGGTAGHWARRPLSLDEVEAMFVCRRR